MALIKALSNHKADESSQTKSQSYNCNSCNLEDDSENKKQNLEDNPNEDVSNDKYTHDTLLLLKEMKQNKYVVMPMKPMTEEELEEHKFRLSLAMLTICLGTKISKKIGIYKYLCADFK